MELSQSERVRWVVKWLSQKWGITTAEVGRRLGYPSNTYFSQVINGKKPMASSLIDKLAAQDPSINIDFLTGVSDEMLIGEERPGAPEAQPSENIGQLKQQPIPTPRVGIFVPPELAQMVTDLTSIVRDQQAMIRNLIEKWCEKEGNR